VKIWDPFIRVFHWSLVLLFAIAFLTGDDIEWMHLWAGYAIAALVALRILWGFIGSRHARFSDFVKGPGTVFQYLIGRASDHHAHRALDHRAPDDNRCLLGF
jgi:cytochrome b